MPFGKCSPVGLYVGSVSELDDGVGLFQDVDPVGNASLVGCGALVGSADPPDSGVLVGCGAIVGCGALVGHSPAVGREPVVVLGSLEADDG